MALALTDADLKEMNMVRADRRVFVGVDLGQRRSHSAMVVVERFEEWPTELTDILRGAGPRKRYVVRQAERMALGTPYVDVVMRVKQMVGRVMATKGQCTLVVDEGGPGVPVVERMRESDMGCRIQAIVITSGQVATATTAPRAVLLTNLQMMAEMGELEIAGGCRHGEQLRRELVQVRLSGHSGETDDLVLALALACWKARVR